MRIKTAKRIGIALLAFLLSVLSVPSVWAANGESGIDDAEKKLWSTPVDKSKIFCDENAASVFTAICTRRAVPTSLQASSERYIDITMHAGDHGHFDGNVKERTVTFYRSDNFNDTTKPIAESEEYVFVGWSTKPEATQVDIDVDLVKAYEVGTDIYAVWSNKAYVMYNINNGAWESPDGEIYQMVLMEYDAGANFKPLNPEPYPFEQFYDFAGWTEGTSSENTVPYTAETAINKYWTEVYANWDYNASRMDNELTVGRLYDIQAGVSIPAYKFTPKESGWYEIFSDGIEEDGTDRQGVIRLQDVHDHQLGMEKFIDPTTENGEYDVHLYYEMEAGKTYYVRFGEMSGGYIRFNAGVRKAETATVTFDTNHGDDVWFVDGENKSTTFDMTVPVGDDIANYRFGDKMVINDDTITFNVWAKESNPDEIHGYLIVDGPMTVYADYIELVAIHLDYNGGYNPLKPEETSYIAKYHRWDKFVTPIDPKIDNPRLKFAGWSTNPNATKPEEEYRESASESAAGIAEKLNGRSLYAIYTEPVTVVFNTTGDAYMMDDPNAITYESSYGKGHIFYGMAVMHEDPQVLARGWVDQDGVFVPVVSTEYGAYTIEKDTTFTSVLGYKIMAYGNGGCFPYGGIGCYSVELAVFDYNGPDTMFSYEDAESKLGVPRNDDETKQFLGFATDADAAEPDIVDGSTYLNSLYSIYAVWSGEEDEEADGESNEGEEEVPAAPNTGNNSVQNGASVVDYALPLVFVIIFVLFGLIEFHSIRQR